MARKLAPFNYQGSKSKEIGKLSRFIPENSDIVEPFFGSGTVSLYRNAKSIVANDINPEICNIWKWCDNPYFIEVVKDYMNEDHRFPEYYYTKRDEYNSKFLPTLNFSAHRAAVFYYIINSCHAALLRYGPNGFNTSFKLYLANGRKYNVDQRIESLLEIKSKLIGEVQSVDAIKFLKTLELDTSQIIYLDPPYIKSGVDYSMDSWGPGSEYRLLEYCAVLRNPIVMSNYYSDELVADAKSLGYDIYEHSSVRMAGTKTVSKQDIIVYKNI